MTTGSGRTPDVGSVPTDACNTCSSVEFGLVQIAVPDPPGRAITDDRGYPRANDHGHYRLHGEDVIDKILTVVWNVYEIEPMAAQGRLRRFRNVR